MFVMLLKTGSDKLVVLNNYVSRYRNNGSSANVFKTVDFRKCLLRLKVPIFISYDIFFLMTLVVYLSFLNNLSMDIILI